MFLLEIGIVVAYTIIYLSLFKGSDYIRKTVYFILGSILLVFPLEFFGIDFNLIAIIPGIIIFVIWELSNKSIAGIQQNDTKIPIQISKISEVSLINDASKVKKIVIVTFFASPVLVIILEVLMQFAIHNLIINKLGSYRSLLDFSATLGFWVSLIALIFAIATRRKFKSDTAKSIRVLNIFTILVSFFAFLTFVWPCDC